MPNSIPITPAQILSEEIVLASIRITSFGGYRRAKRADITALGGRLPDCEAITEGSIKVFPMDRLKNLGTVKRKLFRELSKTLIRGLENSNVFCIPTPDLQKWQGVIDTAERELASEIANVEQNYDTWFADYLAANNDAREIIERLRIPKAAAISRLGMSKSYFRIAPAEEGKGVEEIVAGLARQMFCEIAESCALILKSDTFESGSRAGQKTLHPIKLQIQKMKTWAHLDPDVIGGGIQFISDVLGALPQAGYIEGEAFQRLKSLLELCADADDLIDAASRVHNGWSALDVLEPPAAALAPPLSPCQAEQVEATHVAPHLVAPVVSNISVMPDALCLPLAGVPPGIPAALAPRPAHKAASLESLANLAF